MKRRALLGAAAAAPMLSGCIWSSEFDFEWDEEVQLHDGRVIVVHLEHSYERLSQGALPYGGTNIVRDTTLVFDAGGTTGKVTQLFKGFHPKLLDVHEGVWYTVIYGGDYHRSRELPGQDWGERWHGCDRVAVLRGSQLSPIIAGALPVIFRKANMLLLYGEASEDYKFHRKRVTLKDKSAWLQKHQIGPNDVAICRSARGLV